MHVTFELLLVIAALPVVSSILPTAGVQVHLHNGVTYDLLASQASFGGDPPMTAEKGTAKMLMHSPSTNLLLCENVTDRRGSVEQDYVMLVPRGSCTFQQKAMNAQKLGATGVIVYGNLASRYTLNETTGEQIFPLEHYDYDCQKGTADIPASAVAIPYEARRNDPLLSGTSPSNLCMKNSLDGLASCASDACLLTGNYSSEGMLQACCAWDMHVWMYADPAFNESDVEIPAVFITLEQANRLRADMAQGASVILYTRWRSNYNLSSVLIWALGVLVAALASYMSASEYRSVTRVVMKNLQARAQRDSASVPNGGSDSANGSGTSCTTPRRSPSACPATQAMVVPAAQATPQEETLELGAEHALVFIIMASSGLFILFFFKIYNVVKVLYALGCSKALMQVVFDPIWKCILGKQNKIVLRTGIEDFGDITTVDVVSFFCAYAWGVAWLAVAFTAHHPETLTFFWVTQDIMGACMCILFLSIIKLNSLRVAAILLLVAFFYDIFFVFITPLIFKGQSVMITVATSGGPPKADPSWCEKYPDDADCQGGNPLPMLLTIPRLEDYAGGASMLGLGDIVLPGLLLSFAARLDAAKELVGAIGGGNGGLHSHACPRNSWCFLCNRGYFLPLILSYAVGLLMANAAVYLMNYGQPALLYLVPCCLGTMTSMAWRQSELADLWNGPNMIRTADAIIYRDVEPPSVSGQHEPLPLEDGMEAPIAPSAEGAIGHGSNHKPSSS